MRRSPSIVPDHDVYLVLNRYVAAWSHGSADSLEAAQKAFRAAWEQFYASLSPEQIARWHHTQDARKA